MLERLLLLGSPHSISVRRMRGEHESENPGTLGTRRSPTFVLPDDCQQSNIVEGNLETRAGQHSQGNDDRRIEMCREFCK